MIIKVIFQLKASLLFVSCTFSPPKAAQQLSQSIKELTALLIRVNFYQFKRCFTHMESIKDISKVEFSYGLF